MPNAEITTAELATQVRADVLGLSVLQDYIPVREYLNEWLERNGEAWASFVLICLRLGAGCQVEVERLAHVLGSWIVLLLMSGRLDDYADEDKHAGVWETLGRNRGSFLALALIAEALSAILKLDGEQDLALARAAGILAERLRDASLGQVWDIRGVRTLNEYEQMLALKAAPLVAALTEAVAVMNSADDERRLALIQVGQEIGMALQIVNDYLGVWKPERLSKSRGGDLTQPQLTYPIFYALQVEHPFAEEFRQLVAAAPEVRNTDRMLEILDASGAQEFILAALHLRRASTLKAFEGKALPDDLACLGQWYDQYVLGIIPAQQANRSV